MSEDRIIAARTALNGLENLAIDLENKSRAAMLLGMEGFAEELWESAQSIRAVGTALHRCWSDEFNKRCDDSEVATGQMLVAALACDLKAGG